MKTLKGPAIFLAQFMGEEAPFDNIESMARWASSLGFIGIQVPIGNPAFIDVALAAESQTYADELNGRVQACGVQITERSFISPMEALLMNSTSSVALSVK